MENDTDQSKEFEPTQRKLDEARRRGEVARSPDLSASVALAGLLLVLTLFAAPTFTAVGYALSGILRDSALPWNASPTAAASLLSWVPSLIVPLLPLFALPAALVLMLLLATRSLVFAPDRLQPKLERISPIKNARQRFGLSGWVEFLKSLLKLSAAIALVALFFDASQDEITALALTEALQGLANAATLTVRFLAFGVAISLLIGLVDLLWQMLRQRTRLRMTRQEMKHETRDSEGDSQFKQRRRQRAYDIATNRMLLDVPKAQVVVVNPTHIAVALTWEGKRGTAPRCSAKGADELALRIRELAQKAGVPIHNDIITARALYATVSVGDEVRPEHYRAVAAAIRFAESVRKKALRQ